MSGRILIPILVMVGLLVSFRTADTADGVAPINFTRGILSQGATPYSIDDPTTLEVGPDGRVYIGNDSGVVVALTLNPTTKAVTAVQSITTAAQLQEVYGLAFDPTDSTSPSPIYVTNTISGFGETAAGGGFVTGPAGAYSGKVTRISGATYGTRADIITGLPISNSGHEANGLTFGPDGRLYVAQGGNTNAGVNDPAGFIFTREETPLGGAILVADVKAAGFNGNVTYSPANTYDDNVNQVSGDVSTYAVGLRNPYDLLWHSNGRLYNTDNGPNDGYGYGSTACIPPLQTSTHASQTDEINIIVENGYYGHPNRNRGRTDARQCEYYPNGTPSTGGYTGALIADLPPSSNGLAEYDSATDVFGGQMEGDLLYAAWVNSELHRAKLSADGLSVIEDTTLAVGLQNALDVAVGPDGTIYVAEYGADRISFFRPDETQGTSMTITNVLPAIGGILGGSNVTITGTNFTITAETTIAFGSAHLQNVTVHNSSTITGTTPAHAAGTVDVTVTNSNGAVTRTGGFTFSAGGGTLPPIADAGDDWSGPLAHGSHAHVTLDGRGSTDPDPGGFITSYRWNLGSPTGTLLSSLEVDSVQFTVGSWTAWLTVTDDTGLEHSDDVRIIVTATAANPLPYFCADTNGDRAVNSGDQLKLALAYGKKFGQAGYTRLIDHNSDRAINSGDQLQIAKWYGPQCPAIDRLMYDATKGMEDLGLQNINTAYALGYFQVTPFIPGQGLHLMRGAGLDWHDLIVDYTFPESLLYAPDPTTPGGWRLGGAMFVVPHSKTVIPPDGFPGSEDAWHYHDDLCIWNNFTAVQEFVSQSECMNRPGNPVWVPKAGWLLHLWNFVPNAAGRLVEVNNRFIANSW